jgi:hypothetical protein
MSNKTFKAEIVSVSDVVKTKSNGKQYAVAVVRFTEGPIRGKEYFAQRTLGADKSNIRVGQSVTCYMSVANGNPFFEISTGANVCDTDELKGLLGL